METRWNYCQVCDLVEKCIHGKYYGTVMNDIPLDAYNPELNLTEGYRGMSCHGFDAGKTISDYIKSIETENTGGHCMVDVIKLTSGFVITLNDECLVVWEKMQDWIDNEEGTEFMVVYFGK